MFKTFAHSFRLANAYKVNTVIYSLKSIPVINNLLRESLYSSRKLKKFASVIAILKEFVKIFLGKIIYMLLMVYLPVSLLEGDGNAFMHILFFLTLAGGISNYGLFDPSRDKYYAIFIMRLDAKDFTISNYIYYLLRMFVGFLAVTLGFGIYWGINLFYCIMIPFMVCSVKIIFAAVALKYDSRGITDLKHEGLPYWLVIAVDVVLLAAAYLPVYFDSLIPGSVIVIGTLLLMVGAYFGFLYLYKFKDYRTIQLYVLNPQNLGMNKSAKMKVTQDMFSKKIDADANITSNKKGYGYFVEIFMKRHSKILTKSAKKITAVLFAVFAVAFVASVYVPEADKAIKEYILNNLSFFLIVMYFINRGRTMTQAMFVNCDHSMLQYHFYRQPATVLNIFIRRLKYIVLVNLMPASVIAIGLPLLLYFCGGVKDVRVYPLIFFTIIAMSLFFSVHTMVLYYLLQPYNENMETKNAAYAIISAATYFVCYYVMNMSFPVISFGITVCLFSLIYVCISFAIAYKLAPKTFKIRR